MEGGGPTELEEQVKVLPDGSVLRRDSKGRPYRDYSHEPWYEDWMGISAAIYKSHPEWIEKARARVLLNRAKAEQKAAKIERRYKTNEEKASKVIDTVKSILDNPSSITNNFSLGYKLAIENLKLQITDKVLEYKKAVDATLVAAELGLGAYTLGEFIRPMQSLRLYAPTVRKTVATVSPVLDISQIGLNPYDTSNYIEAPFSTLGAVGEWDLLRGTRYGNAADKIFDMVKYINTGIDISKPAQLLLTTEESKNN